MKWSDLSYDDYYIPYDENQRAIRGFLLTTLGVDLENLPRILFEPFEYFGSQSQQFTKEAAQRIYLDDIIGTSYRDYGNKSVIDAFLRIKRARHYIQQGKVTRDKYFYWLKKPVFEQRAPIILSKTQDDLYFVDGNGNHRVIMYKIMMLSEIAQKYEWVCGDSYDFSRREYNRFQNITRKYWLNALVHVGNPCIGGEVL